MANPPVTGKSAKGNVAGVLGENTAADGRGVMGSDNGPNGTGVYGQGNSGVGVHGVSETGAGVSGASNDDVGVQGISKGGDGVFGRTASPRGAGVHGVHTGGIRTAAAVGVLGESEQGAIAILGRQSGGSGNADILGNDAVLGTGVWGDSSKGPGISGTSSVADGVIGGGINGVRGVSVSANGNGVFGENMAGGVGVQGVSAKGTAVAGKGGRNGVFGVTNSTTDAGVNGQNTGDGFGVFGGSQGGHGVEGHSKSSNGVMGFSEIANGAKGFLAGKDPVFQQDAGAYGESAQQGVMGLTTTASGTGVYGGSTPTGGGAGIGVRGETSSGEGVRGQSFSGGIGVSGISVGNDGVRGHSASGNGVSAFSDRHTGIFAKGPINAGFFEGNVTVTGDVFLTGADCAEDFDIAGAEQIDPGTVVVIDRGGALRASQDAYDKKVAGVVSGAGEFRPGLILDKQQSTGARLPVALVGKVYCKVDAQFGAIEVGDLLTTSPTRGHAMKADDLVRAFGSVIGKALRPLQSGQDLVPILITLQ